MLKKYSILGALLLLTVSPVSAQTLDVACKKKPRTVRAIIRGIQAGVLAQVDPQFNNPRVRVRARCQRLSGQYSFSLENLLSSVNIENSNHPSGLAFGLSGQIAFDFGGATCDYDCRIIISSSGDDPETGQRLITRTESNIPVEEPLTGRFRTTN